MKLRTLFENRNYRHYYRSDGASGASDVSASIRMLKNGTYPGRYFTAGSPTNAAQYYAPTGGVVDLVEANIESGLIVDGWDLPFALYDEWKEDRASQELQYITNQMRDIVPPELVDKYIACFKASGEMGRTIHGPVPISALSVLSDMYPYVKDKNWGNQVTLPTRQLLPEEVRGVHLCEVVYDQSSRSYSNRITETVWDNGTELVVGRLL